MPPKGKKKRASLQLDTSSGQIKEAEVSESSVRQIVEVVEDGEIPDAIETIKKDAAEIEEVVETIEEKIEDKIPKTQEKQVPVEDQPVSEEVSEDTRGSVESLFTTATSTVQPEITVVKKRNTSIGVWIGAMLGVVLAVGVSLIFLVRGPSSISFLSPKSTPTPIKLPTPTALPISQVNRKDITVSVLNGGGVAGAGSKMKALLESKGYVVSSVSNAQEYSHDQTEILAKSGKDEITALLKEDLKVDYSLASETGVVDTNAKYDAQVIVGKE